MEDDPDSTRLRDLDARLAKRTETPERKSRSAAGTSFSQGDLAWRMVIELVTGMVLGLAIGYGLDALFGTLPIFLVLFALIGFAAGVRTMMGTARELTRNAAGKPPATDKGE